VNRWRGVRHWRINPHRLTEEELYIRLGNRWEYWKKNTKKIHPHSLMWWERCVKPQLRREIRSYEAEKRWCYRTMENHLYTCIDEISRSDIPLENKRSHLNLYIAKLCRLHVRQMRTDFLDASVNDRMEEEDPSLYHIIRNEQ
jgi:hypothetical protein